MWLSETEIEKIARSIVKQLEGAGIGVADTEKARSIITRIINENIADEQRLEEDALKLLKQHQAAAGGASLDHDKALRMIKKKLADERGFVL